MNQTRFFADKHGCIVNTISATEALQLSCNGETMVELIPNTSEGATEKHLPVITKEGTKITVQVGSIAHPMSEEHSINFVYLLTKKGGQLYNLCPTSEPVATFLLTEDDEAISAYAYCNLHGFWKSDL